MVFHKCTTKTKEECRITEEEYQRVYAHVAKGNFLNALQQARMTIQGTEKVEENRYQQQFILPMKRNLFGLLTIPVYVNHVRCTFIIDTGAQISGIKEAKGKELGLKQTGRSLAIGSVGGKEKEMTGVYANSFQLGAMEYRNYPMIALKEKDFSLRFGSIDLFQFDGILGWDILSTIDFEMDDIAKQFKVLKNRFRLDHPNMIMGSFPCLIMKTPQGKVGIYGFDSGSKNSWIGEGAIQTFDYHVKEEGTTLGFGVHGMEKLEMKILSEVDLYLYKAHIHLEDTGTGRVALFQNFVFDGVLGNEIFKGRRMRFVNSRQMVLIA